VEALLDNLLRPEPRKWSTGKSVCKSGSAFGHRGHTSVIARPKGDVTRAESRTVVVVESGPLGTADFSLRLIHSGKAKS